MRFLPPFILVLLAGLATSLTALEPADLSRILDSPELTFTLQTTHGTVTESSDQATPGPTSLAARPAFDVDQNAQYIAFSLKLDVSGPGVLSFRVRSTNSAPNFYFVNYAPPYQDLPEAPHADTWYEVSYFVGEGAETATLLMGAIGRPANSVFYFDDFNYQPGIVIQLDDIPSAGAISLNPAKEIYSVGETIAVSIASSPDITVESIDELDQFYGQTTSHPAAFNLTATHNVTLHPNYYQTLDLDGYTAHALLYDTRIDLADDSTFKAKTIAIEDVPANSLLTFDAKMLRYREISVSGDGLSYPSDPPFQSYNQDSGYETFNSLIKYAEPQVLIDVYTNRLAPDQHYLPFRNFKLSQTKNLKIITIGEGQVDATYEPRSTTDTILASLVATPASGWQFLGWSGVATSSKPELDLLIDAPGVLTATFAQIFEFGASKWAFTNNNDTQIALTNDGKGLRITPTENLSPVTLNLQVTGRGTFDATTYFLEADGTTVASTAPTFSNLTKVGNAPLQINQTFYFNNANPIEIRDIIVSGGSGYDDIAFHVNAPDGSIQIAPAKASYLPGDLITLSVQPAWQDRFVGWFGDVYSANDQLEIALDHPLEISAVFTQNIATTNNRSITNRGPVLLDRTGNPDQLAFLPSTFAPGAWTELEVEIAAPVTVGLQLPESLSQLARSYYTANGPLKTSDIETEFPLGTLYCSLPPGTNGPLRIRFTNQSQSPVTGSLSLGFYQDTRNWVPFIKTYQVQLTPDTRFVPIGSTVQVKAFPQNDTNQTFNSWLGRSETEATFDLSVIEGEEVLLSPTFTTPFPIDAVTDITSGDSKWTRESGNVFINSTPYDSAKEESITLQIQGPGVLFFTAPHDASLIDLKILIDGQEARSGDFKLSLENDTETLIDDGLHIVEIVTSLTPEAIASQTQPNAGNITIRSYTPGFAVSGLANLPYRAYDITANQPPVYAAGTQLTLSGQGMPDSVFGKWIGDLAGQPYSVPLTVDSHIVANAVEKRVSSSSSLTATAPENAQFTSTPDEFDIGSITYYIESSSGPSTFVFEIPALTELDLNFSYAEIPARITANGELVYSDALAPSSIAFPVKESPQRIEVTLDLDPSSDLQVWLNATSYQSFQLTGDFGAKQEFVVPDPAKDSYAPGEKVTIKLGNGAPNNDTFYDIAAAYPTLNIIEWLNVDGQKSFQIEMSSHVVLLGSVGAKPTRTLGQIIPSHSIAFQTSTLKSPDGRSTKTGTINSGDSNSYLRINTQGAKHIDFWILAPNNFDLIFTEINVDGLPFAIEGNGLWQKASLAVPEGAKYINAFVDTYSNDPFSISTVNTMTGYGIQYLMTGHGDIQTSPANGASAPSSPLTLTATSEQDYSFQSWNSSTTGDSSERQAKPNESPFLFPSFTKNPDHLIFDQIDLIITDAQLLTEPDRVRFTKAGSNAAAIIEGPGRLKYTFQSSSSTYLKTSIDGQEIQWTDQFTSRNTPAAPELLIPSGSHLVEFEYLKNTNKPDASATLSGLAYEAGTYVWLQPFPPKGSLSIQPNKTFFTPGEQLTLATTPEYQYTFDSWQADLAGAPQTTPYTFTPSDHTNVAVAFRHQAQFTSNRTNWQVTSSSHFPNKNVAQADVQGPGYLSIHQNIVQSLDFSAKIDGLLATSYTNGYYNYLPIPQGHHRIQIQSQLTAPSFEGGLNYTAGYLALLTGDTETLKIEPQQTSYLPGSQITLSPANPSSNLTETIYQVGSQTLLPNASLDYTLNDHLILPVSRLNKFIGTDYATNASPGSIIADTSAQGPAFTIAPSSNLPASLLSTYQGPGTLTFTAQGLTHRYLKLYVNGGLAFTLASDQQVTAKLPAGAITLRWEISVADYYALTSNTTISDIQFTSANLDEFQTWLASEIPAHLFARGQNLAPTDDLDHDGATNQQERENHTNPSIYQLAAHLTVDSSNTPLLRFELPQSIDTDIVNILVYQDQEPVPYWQTYYLNQLDYDSVFSPTSDTNRFELSATQFGDQIKMIRVSIPTP